MHKIFRCSHLISQKTIVEKKLIVDIYLLKIFLVFRMCTVWLNLCLLNVFTALKGTDFYIFIGTAAGVLLCGGPKM